MFTAVLLCFLIAFATTACDKIKRDEENTSSEENTDKTDDFFASMEDVCEGPTVLEYFNKVYATSEDERSFFSKLEITKIHDGIFVERQGLTLENRSEYMILECKVINALYNSENSNETVIIPLFLNVNFEIGEMYYRGTLNVADVKKWLLELDYIYAISFTNPADSYVDLDSNETQIETEIQKCLLKSYDILPSKDGKVCIQMLDDFLQERNVSYLPKEDIYGMDKFCYDGISCEEFENNVKELSEYLDNKYHKLHPDF